MTNMRYAWGRESHRSLEDRAHRRYRNPSCHLPRLAPCTSRLSCNFWPNTDQGSAKDSRSESLVHIRYYLMNNIHAFNQNRRHWHNARCRHRKHLHIVAVLQIGRECTMKLLNSSIWMDVIICIAVGQSLTLLECYRSSSQELSCKI